MRRLLLILVISSPVLAKTPVSLQDIRLPKGFEISLYASEVEDARSMTLSPSGVLYVGSREAGNVYALIDKNKDFRVDQIFIIAKNMNMPNGVAFLGNSLYVAEIDRILRYDDIENRLDHPPDPVLVNDSFPHDKTHGWKFIRFSPDEQLYFPVGAPCNICKTDEDRYAVIMRMNSNGTALEVFARGIRNTVGFDWHPVTNVLYFTDNGRDMLGDNIPPDELNRAGGSGFHFGYPYCHGKSIPDPEFGNKGSCAEFVAPVQELGPHVAALGMRFYTGAMFPREYRNQIFIAEHGSWNRSKPIGYRITLVSLSEVNGLPERYEVFAEGWLKSGHAWGRPVDVQEMPDGSLLVSDDMADAIYRITYNKPLNR